MAHDKMTPTRSSVRLGAARNLTLSQSSALAGRNGIPPTTNFMNPTTKKIPTPQYINHIAIVSSHHAA